MKLVSVIAAVLTAGFLSCAVEAQTQITSPNLITNPTFVGTTGWTTTGAVGGNGPTHPAAPANGNGYTFTYSQGTIAQTYAINQALSSVGAGVQIAGFDYGFKYRFGCANNIGGYCENPNGVQDTLNATSTITSNTGATLYTRTYQLGANAPAPYSPTFSSVDTQQRFSTALPIENLGNFRISFTGQDNGYWGGNYGPTIKDVYSKAVYTVDPCVANPLYSPSCSNYNQVLTSQTIYAQSYAINQALNLSGAGVQINGFQYGYDYYVGGDWCSSAFLIFCTGWSSSSMAVDVNVTSSTGSSLYTATHNHGANTSGSPSYSYVFPTQRLLSTMGNFSLSTREVGTTALYSSWSRWQYTPDPCTVNPLSSTSCSGYQQAYLEQQCASNPLYSTQCAGYAAAYQTQQCSANQLYNTSCPGYAAAYLNYQCSINPLYSTTCAGYETAYRDQQCSINPLFSTTCSGYRTAYHDQQCSLDPLFATDCVGYGAAYLNQQCSINPLYSTQCPGYAAAYKSQQCSLNALYATDCPGYAVAYKNQQCSANPLYATDCPGYTEAYHNQQCTANPLYMSDCAGYQTAYFTQQCNLNGLYDRACPNYSTAYAKKMVLEQQNLASTVATAGVIASTAPVSTTTSTVDSSSGTISSTPSSTGSATVDKAIAAPAPTTNSAAAPAAPVQLVAPAPAPAAPTAPQQQAKNEGGEKKPEGKPEGGDKQGGGPQPQMAQGPQGGGDKPAQPTARQALAERRAEAAKKEAVEKGKNLANEMGKASDMESQKQVQNVVIQAMGFTPGFDTYNKAMLPDTVGYKPFTVYNNQKNIDSRANLRMWTGTDRLHNELVDSQYNLGK